MSLICHPSRSPFTRLILAVALVCALLATQFALNRHVIDHSGSAAMITVSAVNADEAPASHDGPGCLVCLEHQAHGSALTTSVILALALTVSIMMARALPPNKPYLAPERARQRAPPVFS